MPTQTSENRSPSIDEIEIGEATVEQLIAALAKTLDAKGHDITNVGNVTAQYIDVQQVDFRPINPPDPPDNGFILFVDDSDGKLKSIDSAGNMTTIVS